MSYWDHCKPVQRQRLVAIDEIARASVALLDEGGLRSLTLRAVSQRLGVAAASLYSRVESVDDLFDLGLDRALQDDADMQAAIDYEGIAALMHSFFRHLSAHRWAGLVIAMRAPRGPAYTRLSERMCVLLEGAGASDPLGVAYRLSNLVIGSALTAPMATDETESPIDQYLAPTYARLHQQNSLSPELNLAAGVDALLEPIERPRE